MSGATARQQSMRQLVHINQRWARKQGGQTIRLTQIHRADRLVEYVDEATQSGSALTFNTLRREYDLLVSAEGYR